MLGRVRPALRVGAEGLIDDRRVGWKARDAVQDIRKRQPVRPDKGHATLKSREPGLELWTHESTDGSGAGHHEDVPGLGEYPQDVIDQARQIVDDRDRSLV